jgi:hypothetical protein
MEVLSPEEREGEKCYENPKKEVAKESSSKSPK